MGAGNTKHTMKERLKKTWNGRVAGSVKAIVAPRPYVLDRINFIMACHALYQLKTRGEHERTVSRSGPSRSR